MKRTTITKNSDIKEENSIYDLDDNMFNKIININIDGVLTEISDIKILNYETDKYDDLNIDNNKVIISKITLKWNTNDSSLVNLLRRSILSEITTNCIEYVIFNINTSSRPDEIIALRLGQLVLNNDKYIQKDMYRCKFFFKGNTTKTLNGDIGTIFTSNNLDNENLHITYETPIIKLFDKQELDFEIIIKQGKGKDHVKFRPVSTFAFKKFQNYHEITFESIGMLNPMTIITEGLKNIQTAKNREAETIFSKIINI